MRKSSRCFGKTLLEGVSPHRLCYMLVLQAFESLRHLRNTRTLAVKNWSSSSFEIQMDFNSSSRLEGRLLYLFGYNMAMLFII